jgi:hypothetical protein
MRVFVPPAVRVRERFAALRQRYGDEIVESYYAEGPLAYATSGEQGVAEHLPSFYDRVTWPELLHDIAYGVVASQFSALLARALAQAEACDSAGGAGSSCIRDDDDLDLGMSITSTATFAFFTMWFPIAWSWYR